MNTKTRIKLKRAFSPSNKTVRVILSVCLFLSFIWLDFYKIMTSVNNVIINFGHFGNLPTYVFVSVLFRALIDYLIFELLFFIYRFFLGFSIYSFLIPKDILMFKFRFWYMIRNLILGIVFNIRFFFPYFTTYISVFEMFFNMAFCICLFFDLNREYVEPIVSQFVFRTMALPVVVYQTYKLILLVWGVL